MAWTSAWAISASWLGFNLQSLYSGISCPKLHQFPHGLFLPPQQSPTNLISTLLITCSFKSIVYSLSCFFPSLRVLHLQNQGETPKFNSLFIQAYWLNCLSNPLSQNLTIFCDFNFNLVSLFILLWKLHALRILRTGIFFIRWNNKSIWYCVIYFTLLALSQLDSRCRDSWRIFLTFWR